jgi:chromosome partitioning protein
MGSRTESEKANMAKNNGIIQVKVGVGRSTVATNLAGELAKKGRTVLIDCDMPQGTSASWYSLRREIGRADDLEADTARDHRELIQKVERHAKGADFIVLDGPPRIAEMTRAILMLADVCLIPVGASVAEVWATTDVLTIIDEAKKARKKVKAYIAWTRHRAYTSLARDLTDQVEKELGLPALETTLGLRVAYPTALGNGRTVAELGDPVAREEIRAFVANVVRL